MPIAVLCPGCNARLNAPDAAAGKTVKCPKCQAPMILPGPEPDAPPPPPPKKSGTAPRPPVRQPAAKSPPVEDEDDRQRKKTRPAEPDDEDRPRRKPRPAGAEDEEDDRPRKKSRAVDELDEADRPRPKRRPADDEDGEDDDRPRKRKPAKSGPPVALLVGGGIAAFLLLAGGAFAAYWFGFRGGDSDTGVGGGSGGGSGGGGKAAVPAGWVVVSPPGAGFKMYVPHIPPRAARWDPPPAKVSKPTKSKDLEFPTADDTFFYGVVIFLFPETMADADKEKFIAADLNEDRKVPPEFVKQTTRKATLGDRPATEVTMDLDLTGLNARRQRRPEEPSPPDKMKAVCRYCAIGPRGYAVTAAGPAQGFRDADVKAFFDNFEFVSATDIPAEGEVTPKTPDATPKPPDTNPSPAPAVPPPGGWTTYTPKDGSFRVNLPATPSTASAGGQTLYTTAKATQPKVVCAVSVAQGKTVEDLVKEMSFLAKQVGEPKTVTLAGRPAVEVTFEGPPMTGPKGKKKAAEKSLWVMRVLKTDTATYALTIMNRDPGAPPADQVAAFFDSFTLLK